MVRLPGVTSARLVVLLTPRPRGAGAPGATAAPDTQPPPEIVPLDRWALASTLGWPGS
jgi:hypothetical protein